MRILFFFQAEDGIRDYKVTGVQTCALPIWPQIETALNRLGKKGEFIQGMRVTDAETMEVVEWVLAGEVQQDIVGLIHQAGRSEEHTSELQSPCNLVCRLLLEKKNKLCLATRLRVPYSHTGLTT